MSSLNGFGGAQIKCIFYIVTKKIHVIYLPVILVLRIVNNIICYCLIYLDMTGVAI